MASSSGDGAKRQRSSKDVPYELIYWPGIPGRGEFIRLALEEVGASYTDTAHAGGEGQGQGDVQAVLSQISQENVGDDNNPPPLAPPILRHGDDLVISQTPNILMYLAQRHKEHLLPDAEEYPDSWYQVNSLVLTALDGLSNEVHDCHHPIASGLYYEDQKPESLRRARDFVTNRLPKFLGYFERVLTGKASGSGPGSPWLHRGTFTVADLVLFQCLDGVSFMFRRAVAEAEESGKYLHVFALRDAVRKRPKISEYLDSKRRLGYGDGVYRYYAELDLTANEAAEEKTEEEGGKA